MKQTNPTESVVARPQNRCVVCGPDNPRGLQLSFSSTEDGVEALWLAGADWEGYKGVLHGGIIGTLLDEAMAKAVLAQKWHAMTVDLRIRYKHHVSTGETLRIRGWITERKRRRISARAAVTTVEGEKRAEAEATFLTVA